MISGPSTGADGKRRLSTFEEICKDTRKIAEGLLTRLRKVKIDRDKNRMVQKFHLVVEHIWSKNEVIELLKCLSTLKEGLHTHVLCAILEATPFEIQWQTLSNIN